MYEDGRPFFHSRRGQGWGFKGFVVFLGNGMFLGSPRVGYGWS
jgi:hypothetical protein